RRGDPCVTRSKYFIDLRDAVGTVGEGGDCLCTANFEDSVDATKLRSDQHRSVRMPFPVRRSAEHLARAASDACWYGQHHYRGRQWSGTGGYIQSDSLNRANDPLATNPGHDVHGEGLRQLRLVEPADVIDRSLERSQLRGGKRFARRGDLLARNRQRLELHAIETLGISPQSLVALLTDRMDDLRCDVCDIGARVDRWARQCREPFGLRECAPIKNTHQANIFSTGNTSKALAPAFFRLSSVSQNTFSRQTAWIATLSG